MRALGCLQIILCSQQRVPVLVRAKKRHWEYPNAGAHRGTLPLFKRRMSSKSRQFPYRARQSGFHLHVQSRSSSTEGCSKRLQRYKRLAPVLAAEPSADWRLAQSPSFHSGPKSCTQAQCWELQVQKICLPVDDYACVKISRHKVNALFSCGCRSRVTVRGKADLLSHLLYKFIQHYLKHH